MKVIGLTGTIGSGKDTVRDMLEKRFQIRAIKLSDLLDTSILKKKKITVTRTMQQNIGDEVRQKYGGHVLAQVAVSFMRPSDEVKVIDGIRNPGEVDFLKKEFGDDFMLIAIDAPQEERFKRIVERDRPGDPKNMDDFVKADNRDQGVDEPPYGQQVRKCMEMADITIQNDGSLEDFKKKVEEIINSL